MITAYDNWVQMPTMDIYNTNLMLASIQAAKDMYDKGQKRLDDFYDKYGDFMSPFSKDMEAYGNMIGNINNKIDWMYANGIDPLRSEEGRQMVSQLTRSVNPGEFNRMRTNAKLGFEYLKNIEEAKLKGTYDEDYEKWRLSKENGGPGQFADFSSANGMWNIAGPGVYKDPNTLVSPLFEGMEDSYIDSDDQYDYYGVDRDRRALILQANLGALLKTPEGRYQYELVKQELRRRYGYDLPENEALDKYQEFLLDASDRFERRDRRENKEWARTRESQLRREEDTHRTRNDAWLHEQNNKSDYQWDTMEMYDTNRDMQLSEEERTQINGKASDKKTTKNVYERTDANGGAVTVFDPSKDIEERVTPLYAEVRRDVYKDKESQDMVTYTIPNGLISKTLFRQKDGELIPIDVEDTQAIEKHFFGDDTYKNTGYAQFVSTGRMFYKLDKDGAKQYYISGYVSYGSKKDNNAGTKDCYMKVRKPSN